ncbi:MAG: hypothetical protein PF443_09305 [Allgaiera sp.]|jgi:hypothetical protein|nr:hypothetical protein [Allgaiera sp.]
MKIFRMAASVVRRIASKRARHRNRKNLPRARIISNSFGAPMSNEAKCLAATWHNPMGLKSPPPARAGVRRAEKRLAEHRKRLAKIPDTGTISRQVRRQMERCVDYAYRYPAAK